MRIRSLCKRLKRMLNGNFSLLAVISGIAVLLLFTGCESTGSVGDSLPSNSSDLIVDTVQVKPLHVDTLNAYSGDTRPYFSAGHFQDPLFGDVKATGLMKPALAPNGDSLQIDEDTKIKLKLAVNKEAAYGDTLAAEQFKLVEIARLWRGKDWRLDDKVPLVPGKTVASFKVTDEDTLEIPLSSDWVQKYAAFFNRPDSVGYSKYRHNFYGLALVPQDSGKIITINPRDSYFIATKIKVSTDSSTSRDSLHIGLSNWAYSLNRSGTPPASAKTTKIYNTLARTLSFNIDFSSDSIEPSNVTKAELILYRDSLQLKQSLSQGAVRPESGPLYLYYVDKDEFPQSVDPGSPSPAARSIYKKSDDTYRLNITRLVRSGYFVKANPAMAFYIVLSSNNGVILSDILFNDEAGEKSPKIIITSTKHR